MYIYIYIYIYIYLYIYIQFLQKMETLTSRNLSTLIYAETDNYLIRKFNSYENQQIFTFAYCSFKTMFEF